MPTTTTDTPNDTGYASDEQASVTAELESSRVLQQIRDKTDAVVERIQPRIAAVSDYARSEPTKAVLIAAAAGAGLMALLALLARGSRPSPVGTGPRTMAAIRDAAIDLADRAHSVATETIGAARKRASGAVDVAEQQAGDAKVRLEAMQKRATDVADSVAETWASLREQAAPVVDKLKPQIDALATYAKDDPARAALGVATAGAVLIGLRQPAAPLGTVLALSPGQAARERGLTHFGRSFRQQRDRSTFCGSRPDERSQAVAAPGDPLQAPYSSGIGRRAQCFDSDQEQAGGRPSVNKKIWATIVTSALVVACGGGSSGGGGGPRRRRRRGLRRRPRPAGRGRALQRLSQRQEAGAAPARDHRGHAGDAARPAGDDGDAP